MEDGGSGGGGSVAIDTVEIVGPDSLRNWQNGTWEARVEGGNPPYVLSVGIQATVRVAPRGQDAVHGAFGGSEPSYSRMANTLLRL